MTGRAPVGVSHGWPFARRLAVMAELARHLRRGRPAGELLRIHGLSKNWPGRQLRLPGMEKALADMGLPWPRRCGGKRRIVRPAAARVKAAPSPSPCTADPDGAIALEIDARLRRGQTMRAIAADLRMKLSRVKWIRAAGVDRGFGAVLTLEDLARIEQARRDARTVAPRPVPADAATARAAHDAGDTDAAAAFIDRRLHEGISRLEIARELGLSANRVSTVRQCALARGIGRPLDDTARLEISRRRQKEGAGDPPPLPEEPAIAKARLLRGAYARRDRQAALLGDPPPNFDRLRALFENPPARVTLVAPVNAGRGEG